jgi:hypothetical protein
MFSPPLTLQMRCTMEVALDGYSGPQKLDHQLSYCGGPGKG